MPRYFFDASDGRGYSADAQGIDLCSDRDARQEAVALVHALVRDDRHLQEGSSYHVRVRRDDQTLIYKANCRVTGVWMGV